MRIEQNIEVGPRFAGRLNGLVGDVDGAVSVGERARLLTPDAGRQDHIGQLGRLGHKRILHDDEQPLGTQPLADAVQLRQRHGRVGGHDPKQLEGAGFGVAEYLQAWA